MEGGEGEGARGMREGGWERGSALLCGRKTLFVAFRLPLSYSVGEGCEGVVGGN